MDQRKAYFISDLHLGAQWIDNNRAHELAIAGWIRSLADKASALYILGDAIDYWYEYRTVVPRGFVRFFAAIASLTDAGIPVYWLKGNHDVWIFDYLPGEIGVKVIDGPLHTQILGHTFYLEHGDLSGEPRPSYRRMQRIFRNPTAQRLFAAIHPRWTVGFAHRWSSHSRRNGKEASVTIHDDDPLLIFAKNYRAAHPDTEYFIFGHRHILIDMEIDPGCRLVVLGEGFRLMTYGVFDGDRFEIHKIKQH